MQRLRELLQRGEIDMSIFFRELSGIDVQAPTLEPFAASFYSESGRALVAEPIGQWLDDYAARLRSENRDPGLRRAQMDAVNPRYVLRNYLAQQAIDAAEQGDSSILHALQKVLREPYREQVDGAEFAGRRPEWARSRAGCSMLSCSS
jgi:uncharacterized protein YdiU (UPF0061 family)